MTDLDDETRNPKSIEILANGKFTFEKFFDRDGFCSRTGTYRTVWFTIFVIIFFPFFAMTLICFSCNTRRVDKVRTKMTFDEIVDLYFYDFEI